VGAIDDTDDEEIDNRGYCDAPSGFQRHLQGYPGKGRAEELTVDLMDHFECGRIYGELELPRGYGEATHLPLSHELPQPPRLVGKIALLISESSSSQFALRLWQR
jgi:hypothetical protein